jgi:hypothetical protein
VENRRVEGKVRQKIILNFGQFEKAMETGVVDSMILALEKYSDKILCLTESTANDIQN